jgi:hypothetical protein
MLHSGHENLLRIKSLAMLPEYPSYTDGMLCAYSPRERREMAIRSTHFIIGLLRIPVHGEWTMKKNES